MGRGGQSPRRGH